MKHHRRAGGKSFIREFPVLWTPGRDELRLPSVPAPIHQRRAWLVGEHPRGNGEGFKCILCLVFQERALSSIKRNSMSIVGAHLNFWTLPKKYIQVSYVKEKIPSLPRGGGICVLELLHWLFY